MLLNISITSNILHMLLKVNKTLTNGIGVDSTMKGKLKIRIIFRLIRFITIFTQSFPNEKSKQNNFLHFRSPYPLLSPASLIPRQHTKLCTEESHFGQIKREG